MAAPADRLTASAKRGVAAGLLVPLAVGIVGIALFAEAQGSVTTVIGTAVLVSMAALVSGLLVGFLFGIPRSQQRPRTDDADDDESLGFLPNTNLEQVSDWLTKILLGATLTQLGTIADGLGRLVDNVGDAWGATGDKATVADVFAGSLLLYFAVFGFLAGWLLTRAFLAWVLSTIDRLTIRKVVATEVGQTLKRDAGHVMRTVQLEQDVEDRLRTIGLNLVIDRAEGGPDFVCDQGGKPVALEVKYRDEPMSLAEVQRHTTWPDTTGAVLITNVDLTPEAAQWVAGKPDVEVIKWAAGSEALVTEALARVAAA